MGKTKDNNIRIGLDLSINSTGVCILQPNEKPIYYIIAPKLTKKQQSITHSRIHYKTYVKSIKNDSHNIRYISNEISQIITGFARNTDGYPTEVTIEDIAMGARSSSIITLSLLNGYIRSELDHLGIPYKTIPPTQWKKELLGNGAADKETTAFSWSRLDPDAYNFMISNKFPYFDISDAFFLANC